MATSPIYLTETDVGRLVTVKDAIATLEALFATWGQPSTSNLPRQRARLAGGAFNLMGAAYGAKGVHGLKAYAGVKGAQFHSLLYSSLDGKLKAIIEADLLGQMRTGAASGVATKLLAKADAHTLAVIGTGKQSRTQIAAVCAVRPITRVKVFSRTAEHREAYARAVEKELGVQALPASSAQTCVAEADVVVTITNSAEPVFDGADSLFKAFVGGHRLLPYRRVANGTNCGSIRYSLLAIRPISPPRDDFADRAGVVGGEEQPAIGNRDDGACPAAVDRNRIFTDHLAVRRHAADLVGKILGEPEIAVGCHRDAA